MTMICVLTLTQLGFLVRVRHVYYICIGQAQQKQQQTSLMDFSSKISLTFSSVKVSVAMSVSKTLYMALLLRAVSFLKNE